jgi:hypothetical protein
VKFQELEPIVRRREKDTNTPKKSIWLTVEKNQKLTRVNMIGTVLGNVQE